MNSVEKGMLGGFGSVADIGENSKSSLTSEDVKC